MESLPQTMEQFRVYMALKALKKALGYVLGRHPDPSTKIIM